MNLTAKQNRIFCQQMAAIIESITTNKSDMNKNQIYILMGIRVGADQKIIDSKLEEYKKRGIISIEEDIITVPSETKVKK